MGYGAIAAAVAAGASAAATAGIGAAGVAIAAACDGAVGAGAGGPRAMWWNNNTSGFVLRRMTQLVSDGSRPDKVFKDKDVKHVAKALKEYSGEAVSPTQVYNHLRKWRQKWSRQWRSQELYLGGASQKSQYVKTKCNSTH